MTKKFRNVFSGPLLIRLPGKSAMSVSRFAVFETEHMTPDIKKFLNNRWLIEVNMQNKKKIVEVEAEAADNEGEKIDTLVVASEPQEEKKELAEEKLEDEEKDLILVSEKIEDDKISEPKEVENVIEEKELDICSDEELKQEGESDESDYFKWF